MKEIIINSDGAARGNPGPAAAGAVLKDPQGNVVSELSEYLGDNLTNNQAEYRALIMAIAEAKRLGATKLQMFADSELMVKQICGEYRVKNEGIKPLFQEVMSLLRDVNKYTIDYVPREKNKRADGLANLALDERKKLAL